MYRSRSPSLSTSPDTTPSVYVGNRNPALAERLELLEQRQRLRQEADRQQERIRAVTEQLGNVGARTSVVDIVRTKKPARKKRTLGTLKGKIQVLDPDWWKPMTEDEVEDFLAGRG